VDEPQVAAWAWMLSITFRSRESAKEGWVMDIIKSQFDRIRQQLAGLSASQKMLCGSLVVIMLMTLFFWARYAGTPEWEAVLDQQLSQEELGRIQMQLTSAGIEHKLSGDGKLLVPADRKVQAIASLAMSGAVPKNISSGFDEMIKQLTAWDGQSRETAIFNRGKELSLERVIAAMPGVAAANVFIDPHFERRLAGNVEPTATVNVLLKDSAANGNKTMATAIATLVAGAQSGLTAGKVKIVINGKSVPVQDASSPNEGIDGTLAMDLQRAAERDYVEKIEKLFPQIDGMRVSVTVKVNNTSEQIDSKEYDKNKSFHMEESLMSQNRDESAPAPLAGEAGMVPNGGASITPQASTQPPRTSSQNGDSTKWTNLPGVTQKSQHRPAGEATPVGASVRIPRSFFVRVARQKDPSKKEPDNATVEKCMNEEIASIQKAVTACTQIKDAESITVAAYSDLLPLEEHNAPVATAGISGMLGGHVKEVTLGALAVMSLFMMSMIVRKGAPAPKPAAIAAAPAPEKPPVGSAANPLEVGETLAGEVGESNATLDGMELDEDSIKSQQMLTQVTELVGENPDMAASLIKRWMNNR
jgi:flagellar M-ring protein FliF